jgi:hypothetical protein
VGHWKFEQLRSGPRRTPQEAELFKDENTEDGEYAGNDHLVREVLQNTLDAASARSADPVRVRLALHDASEAPSAKRLADYFSRLRKPLEGRDFAFSSSGAPEVPCRFLVCEDFGTRGLEGNIELFTDPAQGSDRREDFYWFWRNIGRSGKTGDDLGRWGLGKTVFRAVSRVGCMFGLTIRESDGRSLLMGQTVLQPHQHNRIEYHPEGYYCSDDGNDEFPLPIENANEIAEFRSEWLLTRISEPGMSVIAPFVPEELREDRLLQAVIVHFFTRIIRGQLEVEISGPEMECVLLNTDTIESAAELVKWNGSKRMKRHAAPPLRFAKSCLRESPTRSSLLLGTAGTPTLEGALSQPELETMQSNFGLGDLVSLRIKMALPRKHGPDVVGEMDVYLQRNADGRRCDSYYVREGMTITKINSRAALRGVNSLVIVDSGPLAELLGDTEGPAHEDWNKSADRPKKEWKTWSGRVAFSRRIVDSLVEYLTPPSKGPDRDLLSNIFSVERVGGKQRNLANGGTQPIRGEFPVVTPKPKWFQISQRAGGFTVNRNPVLPLPESPRLRVSLAYDIPRGNPLRNWNPLDFQISDQNGGIKPKGKGVAAKLAEGNVVELAVSEESFLFAVDGFDRHRDLYVRVDDVSGATEVEEEPQ